ncbi:MAG: M81 family metallopeptidase, partial [Planctomycetaceae bacterium]
MKRIGILALLHESNTFLRQPTTLQHFQDNLLTEGESVLSALRGTPHETGGFLDVLDADPELRPVGIFAARAMPFGPVSADCWNHLKSRLTQCLQDAGPLDGLLVAPHGATVAESAADADGDWLQLVRELVGQEMLICGTLDLHANVSPLLVSSCDALFGYRTNPHLDQFACGRRAALCLQQALRTATRPAMQLTQIPLVVNIEAQATSEPQGRALFDRADQLERQPGISGVSCLYGFPYSDVPQMGATVIVVAESDQRLATATAHRMAAEWWAMRDQFSGNLIPVAA